MEQGTAGVLAPALEETRTQACPSCGAQVVHHWVYVPWCDACGWNVLTGFEREAPRGRAGRMADAAGRRAGNRLYRQLLADPRLSPPRLSVVGVVTATISSVIAGVAVLSFVLGVRGSLPPWSPASLIGLLLLAFGWVARPRIPSSPRRTVTAADAPELYALLDRVAAAAGTRRPAVVALTGHWNASSGPSGWRLRRTLSLGLPLWHALAPDERVALLGHELGHDRNGDPRRIIVTVIALQTLEGWIDFIYPDRLIESGGILAAIVEVPFNVVRLAIGELLAWLHLGLVLLLLNDGQRAEYYADRLAARAAGTASAVRMLERLGRSGAMTRALGITNRDGTPDGFWQELRRQADFRSEYEDRRVRRAELELGTDPTSAHPTTTQRIDVLRAAPVEAGAVSLDEAASARIDAELARHAAELTPRLLLAYRSRRPVDDD